MVKCSGGFSSDFAVIILAQVRKQLPPPRVFTGTSEGAKGEMYLCSKAEVIPAVDGFSFYVVSCFLFVRHDDLEMHFSLIVSFGSLYTDFEGKRCTKIQDQNVSRVVVHVTGHDFRQRNGNRFDVTCGRQIMMHRCVNDHFPFNLNQPSSDLTQEWTLRWTHFGKERLEIFQPFFAPPQNLYNNTKLIKILLYIYIFGSNGESIFSIHRPGRL